MSNVIQFKRRAAPLAAPTSDPLKASAYNLSDLLDFEYTDTDIIDENGQIYTATPETQLAMIAYFDAFGFDYEKYCKEPGPFVLWHALGSELAGYAKMCLIYRQTWEIVKRRHPADVIAYVEAVAAQDRESIMKYRHVGEEAYQQALAKQEAEDK
ncbi:hypothetical protein ACGYU5_15320 [Burkholderia pseudomallei]